MEEAQIQYIKSKVKELGSIEEVEKFYRLDDNVTKFARKYASEFYNKKKKRKKIKTK